MLRNEGSEKNLALKEFVLELPDLDNDGGLREGGGAGAGLKSRF